MPSSWVDVANTGLTRLGVNPIVSFTDGTREANAVNSCYQKCRDITLRLHPWNCAKTRALLSPDSTAPAFDYPYQFSLPADWLRALDISSDAAGRDVRLGSRPRYAIEGKKILFDSSALYLRYIQRVTDAVQLDETCADAIGAYIAYYLAQTFFKNSALTKNMRAQFKDVLADARSVNAQEQQTSSIPDHFERVRMGPS